MIGFLLLVLVVLYFLGYVHLPALPISDIVLFNLFGRAISLYDVLIFLVIIYLVDLLPNPFRDIAAVLLVLYLLSFFSIVTIFGFTNVIVLVIIFGLIYYFLTGHH